MVVHGINMLTINPLVADYVHDVSKGKGTALGQVLSSGGSFLGSGGVYFFIKMGVDLRNLHYIFSFTSIISFTIVSIWIKGGYYYYREMGHTEDSFL